MTHRRSFYRQQYRPTLEQLEPRWALATNIYLDFGDSLTGPLGMTKDGTNPVHPPDLRSIHGPRTTEQGNDNIGVTDDSVLSFRSFNSVASNFPLGAAAEFRKNMIRVVERYYAPFDVNVIASDPTLPFKGSKTIQEVAAIQASNPGSTYIFVMNLSANPGTLSGYNGRANSDDDSDLDVDGQPNNKADAAVLFLDDKFSEEELANLNLTALQWGGSAAHEAGHNFGLRHTDNEKSDVARLTNNDLMSKKGNDRNYHNYTQITNFPMALAGSELSLWKDGATKQNAYDVLARNLGIRQYAPAYITGTSAADYISVTKNSSGNADVIVRAFKDDTHTDFLDSYGYSISLSLGTSLYINGGYESDFIEIDASLGVPITVVGEHGEDRVRLKGTGASTAAYSSRGVVATMLDGNASYEAGFSMTTGQITTSISMQEFRPGGDSQLEFQGVAELVVTLPDDGDSVLNFTETANGAQLIEGDIDTDKEFFPVVSSSPSLTVRGSIRGSTIYNLGSLSPNLSLTILGRSPDDTVVFSQVGVGVLTNDAITGLKQPKIDHSTVDLKPIKWLANSIEALQFSDTVRLVVNNLQMPNTSLVFNMPQTSQPNDAGILQGKGAFKSIDAVSGINIRPGTPQFLEFGIFEVEDLTFGSILLMPEIQGPTKGVQFDQLKATRKVFLRRPDSITDNAVLDVKIASGYLPALGTVFTIIDNAGSDRVVGKFRNMPEGANMSFNGGAVKMKLSYQGGDGNDVTLKVIDNRPTIGSVQLSPGTVDDSGAELLTVIAGNVYSSDNRIDEVRFYLDSNRNNAFDAATDRELGVVGNLNGRNGDYRWTGAVGGLVPGDYRIFVQATQFVPGGKLLSDAEYALLHVVAAPLPPPATRMLGTERRINTATTGNQDHPFVGVSSNGTVSVVFGENDNSAYLQRYDASGTTIGSNTKLANIPSFLNDIAVADDGSFIGVWNANGNAFFQRFSANGTAVGSAVQVSTANKVIYDGPRESVRVVRAANGNFVVAWTEADPDTTENLFIRRYTATGTPTDAAPVRVNSQLNGGSRPFDISGNSVGDFVVAWWNPNDNNIKGVTARNSGKDLGQEFKINVKTGVAPQFSLYGAVSVAMNEAGEFTVAFDAGGIQVRRFRANGTAIDASEFQANQSNTPVRFPIVAVAKSGHTVVGWQALGLDVGDKSYEGGVYAQAFAPNGVKLGSQFRVATTMPGFQTLTGLAVDDNAQFTATWEGNGTGDSGGAFMQRFEVIRNQPPSQVQLSNLSVRERVSGEEIGTLTAIDPDAGQSHTFAVDDARFEVVSNVLRLKAAEFIGNAGEQYVTIKVTATDSGSPTASLQKAFSIIVLVNETPWQNRVEPLDVTGDGGVHPIDALMVINLLNDDGTGILDSKHGLPMARSSSATDTYYDTSGDGHCTAIDALLIINYLNDPPGGEQEGESLADSAAAALLAAPIAGYPGAGNAVCRTTSVTDLPVTRIAGAADPLAVRPVVFPSQIVTENHDRAIDQLVAKAGKCKDPFEDEDWIPIDVAAAEVLRAR